jgi:hypothetical protein
VTMHVTRIARSFLNLNWLQRMIDEPQLGGRRHLLLDERGWRPLDPWFIVSLEVSLDLGSATSIYTLCEDVSMSKRPLQRVRLHTSRLRL